MTNSSKFTTLKKEPQIAGLSPNDSNIEFIGNRETKTVFWLQNGNNHYFSDLPEKYYKLLKEAYVKDPKAMCFLKAVTDDEKRQVELFTYYMYGDVDATADIENGVLTPSENFRDSKNCPSLLWDSKKMKINNHVLTRRQLSIIDMVAENLPDKAIASALFIETSTLDFHKGKLFKALNINSKTELLTLAFKHKIIA